MALLAECLVDLADASLRREVFEQLRSLARLNIVLGNGSLFYGNASHFLGLIAASEGRDDEAGRLFAAAMAMHERMKATPWVVRTQIEQAELHLRTGATERARVLAAAAEQRAHAFGMTRAEARASAVASRAVC